MSLILRATIGGFKQLPGIKHLPSRPWGEQALNGLVAAASLTAGTAVGYYSYAHRYGTGTAAMYGAISMHPATGIPLVTIETGRRFLDKHYKQQQVKRQSSFVKNQMNDRFGTISMMRQYSGQQMRRDHSSAQRVLGNEAVYLHR